MLNAGAINTAAIHASPQRVQRSLSSESQSALRETQLLLAQSQGFVYLPLLVDAEDSASNAWQWLQPQLPRQASPLAWPHLAPNASTDDVRQAVQILNAALDKAIARLPAKSLLYLNASAWPDSPLLGAWPQYLNTRRESLRRKKHALVLAWPQSASEALMAGAPDLWSMRALTPWIESTTTLAAASTLHAAPASETSTTANTTNTALWRERDEAAYRTLLHSHSLQASNLSWPDALALLEQLYEIGPRQKALDLGECLLGIATRTTDMPEPILAELHHWLGVIYHASGAPDEALQHAQIATDLFRRAAQAQPQMFEPALAGSLNNLANLFSYLGQRERALATAQEAVTIRRRLSQAQPQAFEPDLAGSLNNLARSLIDLNQREPALAAAQEAVEIYQRWAAQYPDAYASNLAIAQRTLQILQNP